MPPPAAPSAAPVAAALARSIEDFLADHPHAAILEDGRLLFDLRLASCSVSADHGRCLLHLWSEDRNLVRTISAIQPRRDTLRLETHRFGQTKSQTLTLVPDPDFRTPTARDTSRRRYLRTLEQALATHFPGWTPESFRSAMDLEHSFGPAYARGILTKGQSAWAIIGVGPDEPPATIDGALTLGILWLDYCREHSQRPPRLPRTSRRRPSRLRCDRPHSHGLAQPRARPVGTPRTQPLHRRTHPQPYRRQRQPRHPAPSRLRSRRPRSIAPPSPSTISARCSRPISSPTLKSAPAPPPKSPSLSTVSNTPASATASSPAPSRIADQIFFGAGPSETLLDETTEDLFLDLIDRLFRGRHPAASSSDPLFRLQPERWLESVLRRDLSLIDPNFGDAPVYSQLFSFASANRTLLDLLTVTRQGRLAILELKADDDLHLPLQAIDYWTRIRMLHRAGDIARHGYFPGIELSPDDPLLYCVAPALHIHPANETVFRALAPTIPWELIAVDEHWRQDCRVLLRKRRTRSS